MCRDCLENINNFNISQNVSLFASKSYDLVKIIK